MVWAVCGRSARDGPEGGVQDHLAMRQDVRGLTVMDHGGRHQAKAGVVVLMVVPLEEGLAEAASVFDGAEAIRETRAVFQGAKLAFRIRIVVGDMRAAVGFDDAQIGQQQAPLVWISSTSRDRRGR